MLLHEHAAEAEVSCDRCDLTRVVRLDAADRDERVAALRERIGGEVLELARLVAAVGEARVAVLALGPDLDLAAEVLGEALEAVDRGGAEREGYAREVGERHVVSVSPGKRSSSGRMLSTHASWRWARNISHVQSVVGVLDPVGEEDAVEVVELVLHRAGAEAAEALDVLVAVRIEVGDLDLDVRGEEAAEIGDAEAALVALRTSRPRRRGRRD